MISITPSKDELYMNLLTEYADLSGEERKKSFVYKYLKANKLKRAGKLAQDKDAILNYVNRKRKDRYLFFAALNMAHEKNILTDSEYLGLFVELTGEKDCEKVSGELIEKYEHKFLCDCINDFFMNNGFSLSKRGKIKSDKAKCYVDDLDLWRQFYADIPEDELGALKTSDACELTEEYEKECTLLLNTLNARKVDNAFVPLYFDSEVGAGIYIIDTNRFQTDVTDESCCVCTVFFNDLNCFDNEFGTVDLEMNVEFFESVAEAFRDIKENKCIFFDNYPDHNDIRKRNEISSRFSNFFLFENAGPGISGNKAVQDTAGEINKGYIDKKVKTFHGKK